MRAPALAGVGSSSEGQGARGGCTQPLHAAGPALRHRPALLPLGPTLPQALVPCTGEPPGHHGGVTDAGGSLPWVLVERLTLWLARTNAWIVAPSGPGGDCVLVDAPPEPTSLLDRLAALDLRLVAVLATHGHVDHVGGISTVVRSHDPRLPVHIHDHDLAMLLDPRGAGGVLAQHLGALDVSPPEVVAGLDDGERVSGAGLTFTALHTPGHTPGSVCLRLDVEGEAPRLFSGDHLFARSIGRTDLPGGSFEHLMASMVDKVLPLPDEVEVLPGHGPVTTIGRERATNPFLAGLPGPTRTSPGLRA